MRLQKYPDLVLVLNGLSGASFSVVTNPSSPVIPSGASKRAHVKKKHVLIGCKHDMFSRQTFEVWSTLLLST